jgi:ADP-ribose pyrophosphatase YjhB (NUDIX family)
MDDKLYQFIIKVAAISKIGLLFSKDPYAIENYNQLQDLSKELIEDLGKFKIEGPNYFSRDIYPTPNVSVRALVFNERKQLLLVKEASLGTWSLPGGWCDLFETPSEAIIKEVIQEAGIHIKVEKLLGISDRIKYKTNKKWSEYAVMFLATIIEDTKVFGHEVSEVGFFDLNNLPELSFKSNIDEIKRAINAIEDNSSYFD